MNDATTTPASPLLPGPDRLKQIAEQLKGGQTPEPVTVRELLRWFRVERRGSYIVQWIRQALSEAKLTTKPDFEGSYIDSLIEFVLAEEETATQPAKPPQNAEVSALPTAQVTADPTYRIGKLRSANTRPVAVNPNQTIIEAITIMLVNDFSQLPVMVGDRDVKGIISWTSIGRRIALSVKCTEVRECMEMPHVISADASLFDAINEIVTNQYVLIRDSANKISGIVTTSDLSLQFRQLAEPFLLLGEIENHVRRIIERGRFSDAQLRQCCDPNDKDRTVQGVFDLTFGEYIRLFENPESWSQVRLPIDRKVFIERLDKVRQIRNDVMHFDPDGISDDDLDALRKFTGFLQLLQPLLPSGQ